MGRISIVALAAAGLAVLPSSAPAATSYTIRTAGGEVTHIGSFKPRVDPRPRAAIRAFGRPDTVRAIADGMACNMRWHRLGLKLKFSNFGGGGSACHGAHGRIQRANVKGAEGRRWRTEAGLRLGHRQSQIRRRHPDATRHRHSWWLATTMVPYGMNCPCPHPSLRAKITHRRVTSFRMWLGMAGD